MERNMQASRTNYATTSEVEASVPQILRPRPRHTSHGIFPGPFLRSICKLLAIRLVDLRNLWYQGVICELARQLHEKSCHCLQDGMLLTP